jgi:hypothetical protein
VDKGFHNWEILRLMNAAILAKNLTLAIFVESVSHKGEMFEPIRLYTRVPSRSFASLITA